MSNLRLQLPFGTSGECVDCSRVLQNTNIYHVQASTFDSLHVSVAGCVLLGLIYSIAKGCMRLQMDENPSVPRTGSCTGYHPVPLTRRHDQYKSCREDGVLSEERDSTWCEHARNTFLSSEKDVAQPRKAALDTGERRQPAYIGSSMLTQDQGNGNIFHLGGQSLRQNLLMNFWSFSTCSAPGKLPNFFLPLPWSDFGYYAFRGSSSEFACSPSFTGQYGPSRLSLFERFSIISRSIQPSSE